MNGRLLFWTPREDGSCCRGLRFRLPTTVGGVQASVYQCIPLEGFQLPLAYYCWRGLSLRLPISRPYSSSARVVPPAVIPKSGLGLSSAMWNALTR